MSEPYRSADLSAECERLRKRVAELESALAPPDVVDFDSACPACGSHERTDVAPWWKFGWFRRWPIRVNGKVVGFAARCSQCDTRFREALRNVQVVRPWITVEANYRETRESRDKKATKPNKTSLAHA